MVGNVTADTLCENSVSPVTGSHPCRATHPRPCVLADVPLLRLSERTSPLVPANMGAARRTSPRGLPPKSPRPSDAVHISETLEPRSHAVAPARHDSPRPSPRGSREITSPRVSTTLGEHQRHLQDSASKAESLGRTMDVLADGMAGAGESACGPVQHDSSTMLTARSARLVSDAPVDATRANACLHWWCLRFSMFARAWCRHQHVETGERTRSQRAARMETK